MDNTETPAILDTVIFGLFWIILCIFFKFSFIYYLGDTRSQVSHRYEV
jgi:hypothetical protein